MSSYSFSHQFYQRWTCAPEAIRAAITQELKDITTLLQADTPFESFVFNTHDLDARVDELYENHEAEQAIAKAIADKQAAAEKQRLEEERLEQEKSKVAEESKRKEDAKLKEEAKLREQAAVAQKEQQNNANAIANDVELNTDNKANQSMAIKSNSEESSNNKNTDSDKKPTPEPISAGNDNNIKTVIDKAVSNAAINLSLKETKLGASQPELIRELEMHIDDYLSEQMMQISENLKSWLRAELSQHLTEPDKTMNSSEENIAKKNVH